MLGIFDQAREHLEAAHLHAERQSDTEIEQEAAYALAGLFASQDYPKTEHLAERALAVARSWQNHVWEGRALNRLGNVLTNTMRFPEGRALHEEALMIVNRSDDRWGSADTLDHIGMSRYLAGEVPEARESFGRAAEIFIAAGDLERTASALSSRGLYLAVLDGACATDASPASLRLDASTGLSLCQEIGWRAGEAYALVALATTDLGDARFGDAARHAAEGLAIAREIGHSQWSVIAQLTLGLLHAMIFDDARAHANFVDALERARALGSRQWIERLAAWIARCEARLGVPGAPPALIPSPLPPDFVPVTQSDNVGRFIRSWSTISRQEIWSRR